LGRPKGWRGLAAKIYEETQNGYELVAFALKVMRDPEEDMKLRLEAHHWLADRGFGRPLQLVDLGVTEERRHLDLSKLTDAELETFIAISEKCQADPDARLPLPRLPA
jgi:hypothetical protein